MTDQSPISSWSVQTPLTKTQYDQYKAAGIDYLHAQLLHNRGITSPAAMRRFLDPRFDQLLDPFLLNDMDRAVERTRRALDSAEHITVYGDFDADGVTSAALLTRALRKLKQPGAPLDYFIPHRLEHTRGLSKRGAGQHRPPRNIAAHHHRLWQLRRGRGRLREDPRHRCHHHRPPPAA